MRHVVNDISKISAFVDPLLVVFVTQSRNLHLFCLLYGYPSSSNNAKVSVIVLQTMQIDIIFTIDTM